MKAVQNNHSNDIESIFQRFPSPFDNTLAVQDQVSSPCCSAAPHSSSFLQHHITALLYAAKKKFYSVLLQLLALKPQINHRDEVISCFTPLPPFTDLCKNGMTALLWSVWGGDLQSTTALLDVGADPNFRSEVRPLSLCLPLSAPPHHS
jgi:ankyrin repeat protein